MRDFLRKFRTMKGVGLIALTFVAGLLLILLSTRGEKGETSGVAPAGGEEFSFEKYEKKLEERLKEIVSKVDGVSSVSVMVLLDQGYEEELAEKGSSYLLVRDQNGSQTGIETLRRAPKVRGVAVVCRGGELPQTQKELIALLSALLDLPASRIYVGGVQ